MDKTVITEARAIDALLETPEYFDLKGKSGEKEKFFLYPLSLGRLMMVSKRLLELDLTLSELGGDDPMKEMWRVCGDKPDKVAEIIAVSTLKTKEEIEKKLKERTEFFMWSEELTTQALANILYTIITQSFCEDFMNAIRLVKTLRVTVPKENPANLIARTEGKAPGE